MLDIVATALLIAILIFTVLVVIGVVGLFVFLFKIMLYELRSW